MWGLGTSSPVSTKDSNPTGAWPMGSTQRVVQGNHQTVRKPPVHPTPVHMQHYGDNPTPTPTGSNLGYEIQLFGSQIEVDSLSILSAAAARGEGAGQLFGQTGSTPLFECRTVLLLAVPVSPPQLTCRAAWYSTIIVSSTGIPTLMTSLLSVPAPYCLPSAYTVSFFAR